MLRAIRKKKGWTQQELAARAGFDRVATISDLEKGKGNPTLQTLETLAAALDCSVRDLIAPSKPEADLEAVIDVVRSLPPEDRETVRALARRLAKS